ncbi:MAG: RNA 2',3'-cyclic phosphodiesterase [Rhodanobacter sp.]
MSNQGSLPGFESDLPTDRLFLAIFPDPQHATQLATLATHHLATHHLGGNAVDADRLHVTVFHLGDYVGLPPGLVANATAALFHLAAQPFTIRFDQIGSFSNRQPKSPLVLTASEGNEALHALHKQLAMHLRGSALGQWTRSSFEPHMTVAYDKASMHFEKITPVSWPVSEVVLIHSLLGKTRHIRLADKWLEQSLL